MFYVKNSLDADENVIMTGKVSYFAFLKSYFFIVLFLIFGFIAGSFLFIIPMIFIFFVCDFVNLHHRTCINR